MWRKSSISQCVLEFSRETELFICARVCVWIVYEYEVCIYTCIYMWVCVCRSREIYLFFLIVLCSCGAGKFEIYKTREQAGNSSSCGNPMSEFHNLAGWKLGQAFYAAALKIPSSGNFIFALKVFNWLNDAYPNYGDNLIYSKSTDLYDNWTNILTGGLTNN